MNKLDKKIYSVLLGICFLIFTVQLSFADIVPPGKRSEPYYDPDWSLYGYTQKELLLGILVLAIVIICFAILLRIRKNNDNK